MMYSLVRIIARLPFAMLYLLSDILAWLACDVVRYRRKVVRENLASSFPEKDTKELRKIEKGFYRFLGDYFVETLKLSVMSPEEMSRRLKVEGIGQINEAVERGQSVSLYLGHYCNWEWISSLPLHNIGQGRSRANLPSAGKQDLRPAFRSPTHSLRRPQHPHVRYNAIAHKMEA